MLTKIKKDNQLNNSSLIGKKRYKRIHTELLKTAPERWSPTSNSYLNTTFRMEAPPVGRLLEEERENSHGEWYILGVEECPSIYSLRWGGLPWVPKVGLTPKPCMGCCWAPPGPVGPWQPALYGQGVVLTSSWHQHCPLILYFPYIFRTNSERCKQYVHWNRLNELYAMV